jgi:hypothetical protein
MAIESEVLMAEHQIRFEDGDACEPVMGRSSGAAV